MKFVSLPQLLGCPLFGSNSGLFTVPSFIVSLVGIKKKKGKKKKEGRRDIKGKKEGIQQERRKERMKMLKEKKIKNYLKKSLLVASNWQCQFCWSFWLQQAEGSLV